MAEAERQPVLAVWEDLHWADPSTLEWLGLVLDQTPTVPLCTLLTYRPGFPPPWEPRSYLTQLTLSRLTRPQVEEMIQRVTGGKRLPAEVVRQMVAKTDGVPLFVEELTKMVLEAGGLQEREDRYELTGPLPALAIPATLQDALRARLDRLVEGKAVAQLGAVLGRTFSYELLRAVSPLDELELWRGLVQLVRAEVLYQRGMPPQATYTFKHALLQEAAYQSLLRSMRQQYHQKTAQVLAAQFPDLAETQPEVLAHHYTEAGLAEQAVEHWQRAGEHANERSAHAEAVAHLTQGLEVLAALPETPERAQHELTLHLSLGPALMATRGQHTAEVERVYTRARALCQQVGETPQLFSALGGLQRFYFVRGTMPTARELGEQFLHLAQRQDDPTLLLTGHWLLGTPLFWLGEVATAHAHFERSLALYDPEQHLSTAVTLWALGYSDQALQRGQEALTLAQELAHPFSLGYVLHIMACLHCCLLQDGQSASESVEAGLTLATEHGFPIWLLYGTLLQGWVLAEQGQMDAGIVQLQQSLDTFRATGTELFMPWILGALADAYGKAGRPEEGCVLLGDAMPSVGRTMQHFWEAEVYRLQGACLLALPDANPAEADTCFQQALAIARRQGVKPGELRAAMSLSRLWQRQDKRAAARELLAPVYGWFTEGFDTPDLQEAKALLDELA